jgi:IS30 family transposase
MKKKKKEHAAKRRIIKKSYTRLTDHERDRIAHLLGKGKTLCYVAEKLKRVVSTISREVKKRCDGRSGIYYANLASRKRVQEKEKQRKPKLLEANPRLLLYVYIGMIVFHWSPEQVAHRLKKEYPRDVTMRISHETIYEHLFVHATGVLKKDLLAALRRPRKTRKKRSSTPSLKGKIPNALSIDERPKGVLTRRIPGHWESDLVVGKDHKSALITLVERKTRYVIIIRMIGLDAITFARKVSAALKKLPLKIKKTITHDGGKEMSQHEMITKKTQMKVYIAHPHSPWERPTNENTNGLIREFFPKGTDFCTVSDSRVFYVQELLNTRPRKTLGWLTPTETLLEVLR